MNDRLFFHPSFREYILLTNEALANMYKHAQYRFYQKEGGGEIFAPNIDNYCLIVKVASGPNHKDSRKRNFFNQHPEAATCVREMLYKQGLHPVGLWHTHPEPKPSPSGKDLKTTKDYLDMFEGSRDRYFQVIVGNRGKIPALSVWSVSSTGNEKWVEHPAYSLERINSRLPKTDLKPNRA